MSAEKFGFAQNKVLLGRYAFLEQTCLRTLAGWLPGVPEWDVKNEIGLHIWESAEAAERLRSRLQELRMARPERHVPEDLARLAQELACAQNTAELLATIYLVIKRGLWDAYQRHQELTYPEFDRPTVLIVDDLAEITYRQVQWAEEMLGHLTQDGRYDEWQPWQAYVSGLLASAGGVSGQEANAPLPSRPEGHTLLLPWYECQREPGWPIFDPSIDIEPDREKEPEAHREWRFRHYLNEMTAAETLGSILWMTPEMPWEFQYNTARHLWDEVRHSQLGQTRLRQLGFEPKDIWQVVQIYNVMMTLPAVEQYALLTTVIEPNGMPEKVRNREHWERIGDAISAAAVAYDWSDEGNHIYWGKKWTPVLLKTYGYDETPEEIKARMEAWLLENTPVKMQVRMAEETHQDH